MKKLFLVLALSLFLVQCSHEPTKPAVSAEAPLPPHNLTRTEAIERAARLSDINYELSFNLPEEKKDFTGTATATFKLSDAKTPLRMDFYEGTVNSVQINGTENTAYEYNKTWIKIPATALREGVNSVTVAFTHPYSTSGTGLYRFQDPEDGRVYTYTHFEPYEANQLYPCFDQPDLKAHFTLKVEVPAAWQVISSRHENKITELEGAHGRKLWSFPPSEKISTYLISLHAGPYKMWASKAGPIPLRLFARQSLAKYVVSSEWFDPTRRGLRFYGKYFDYPYPFKKYDEIIVPDFNAGAMENVAAITFSERYVKRGKTTEEEREHTASVILHEMAHMWFGDLVTMKWWNDLWLNESFATYMSALAMDQATPYKAKSWHSFFIWDKLWAYGEDQLVTTHPIEAVVPDTDQAFANFDGITYGKGASVLKQLAFYLGKDFQKGVQNYFKKHAYQNAELKDFMGALAEASHKNLDSWSHDWLETAGLNSLMTDLACDGGKISKLTLTQTAPPDLPTLRDHRTQVGLFAKDPKGNIVLDKTLDVSYGAQPRTVAEAKGLKCPVLVDSNLNDQDYAKNILDKISVQTAQEDLDRVKDPFVRNFLWDTLWEMVRDSRYPVQGYADTILRHISSEKDFKVLNWVLGTINSTLYYFPHRTPMEYQRIAEYAQKFEDLMWKGFTDPHQKPDFQKNYFDNFTRVAQTAQGLEKLKGLLSGKITVSGFQLDQDRRWAIILEISTFDPVIGHKLSELESQRDPSNAGKLMNVASDAARPEAQVKKVWLEKLTGANDLPFNQQRYAMWNLFPQSQTQLKGQFTPEILQSLSQVVKTKDEEFLATYSGSLAPNTCTDQSNKTLGEAIVQGAAYPPIVIKHLRIVKQEDERCVKVRSFAEQEESKSAM